MTRSTGGNSDRTPPLAPGRRPQRRRGARWANWPAQGQRLGHLVEHGHPGRAGKTSVAAHAAAPAPPPMSSNGARRQPGLARGQLGQGRPTAAWVGRHPVGRVRRHISPGPQRSVRSARRRPGTGRSAARPRPPWSRIGMPRHRVVRGRLAGRPGAPPRPPRSPSAGPATGSNVPARGHSSREVAGATVLGGGGYAGRWWARSPRPRRTR